MPATTPPTYVYRHVAIFPRRWDEARPSWRMETLDRVEALPDFVDGLFPDLTVAWRPAVESGVALRESRRRLLQVVTASSSKARADAAAAAFRDLVVSLKRDPADAITVLRYPVELVVV